MTPRVADARVDPPPPPLSSLFAAVPRRDLTPEEHVMRARYIRGRKLPDEDTLDLDQTTPHVQGLLMLHGHAASQGTPGWLDDRKGKITASTVSRITGAVRDYSYDKCMREWLGLYTPPPVSSFGQMMMDWGTLNEDRGLAHYYYHTRGGRGQLVNFGLVCHPEYPWLAASVDGVWDPTLGGTDEEKREGPCITEVKCPVKRQIKPDEVPQHYWEQMQIQMACMGIPRADFIQWKGGPHADEPDEFCVTRVDFDQAWFDRTLLILQQFMAEYEARRTDNATSTTTTTSTTSSRKRPAEDDAH